MYPFDPDFQRLALTEHVDALRRAAAGEGPRPRSRPVRRRVGRWLVSAGLRLELSAAAGRS